MTAPVYVKYMRHALELARKGEGLTRPNPVVGAVVVKNGCVLGEGYHKKAGGPHAEIVALKQAGKKARGAILYVTLEPCCHHGRTPPCTEAIAAAGIRKVIAGTRDPNPIVRGRGIRALKNAAIAVVTGVLEKECRQVNASLFNYIQTGQLHITLKVAMSLDGKIATRSGESRWITSLEARRQVHQMRAKVDAVMVGTGTVLKDDPELTVRLGRKRVVQPVRVTLDSRGRLPLSARVFQNADHEQVLLAVGQEFPAARAKKLAKMGVEVVTCKEKQGRLPLVPLLQALGEREITSLMIEGGGELAAEVLAQGLADRLVVFIAPILIGGKQAPSPMGGEGIARMSEVLKLKEWTCTPVGRDIMIVGTM